MRDLLPAIFTSALPSTVDTNSSSDSNAGAACQQQQESSSSGPRSWSLSGLKDIIWSNGADKEACSNNSGNSNGTAPLASPFASMSGLSKQQQQQDKQALHDSSAAAAGDADADADDARIAVAGADAGDQAAAKAAAAAAAATAAADDDDDNKCNSNKDDNDDSESEWEPAEDESEDLLDSFQAMLERCWFGTDNSSRQQQQGSSELQSHPLLPPSPFQFSSTRTRQLAQRRSQHQQASSSSKPSLTQHYRHSNTQNNSNEDDSWVPSSWLPRPMRRALGRTESSKTSGWHAKPLRVKMAEQVLGEGLVDALELVHRDILESEDPLPEATIKFFLKAGVGVATGWVSFMCVYGAG
jgi:hypothetical protein